ncbi:MAG TPA: hypothetical protein VE689_09655 [Candidatus Udaeobacter sp.]|nr:hypothetical protein [Candidatus Udaeobacter sp.]
MSIPTGQRDGTTKRNRVWGGETVEEVLAPGESIVADPEVLEQSFRSELDHALGRAHAGRLVIRSQHQLSPCSFAAILATS